MLNNYYGNEILSFYINNLLETSKIINNPYKYFSVSFYLIAVIISTLFIIFRLL